MLDLVPHLVLNCIVILAINKIFSEGMVFEKQGNWIMSKVGDFWCKPLICCPACMASVHGTWFYLAFIQAGIFIFPVYILALSGTAYLVSR